MYEDPEESPTEAALTPAQRAKEKADEFRIHAELAAVFEGGRKFDAELRTEFDATTARDLQRTIGKLEKAKTPDSPVLPDSAKTDAAAVLALPETKDLATNDYHIHRRPGEMMIARWLAGDQVESFYTRFQAHFDVAMDGLVEDEKQMHEWKQDETINAYIAALEAAKMKVADRYLRDYIRSHNLFVLSTFAADEMDILHLCDYLMGVPAAEVVGEASAPPDENPSEAERAWFFKLFSLRGMREGEERMCFFAYLQKADEW